MIIINPRKTADGKVLYKISRYKYNCSAAPRSVLRKSGRGAKLEVFKDKKRECRHSKRELVLVSTLFISLVRSGFREP